MGAVVGSYDGIRDLRCDHLTRGLQRTGKGTAQISTARLAPD